MTHAVVIGEPVAPSLAIQDADDPWVVACALSAKVDYFVTGDNALLSLACFKLFQ